MTADRLQPTPWSQRLRWSKTLRRIASEPLVFCEDFPTIARRHEAWWAHDVIDRPLFIGVANSDPSHPLNSRLDLLHQPDAWFDASYQNMQQLYRVGDALPSIRPNFGPALLGGIFGGALRFDRESDTGWTLPFIDDAWSNAPDWCIPDDSPLWTLAQRLTRMVADDAVGRYLVCTTSLGGSGDILLNLRGSTELCLDVLKQPHFIMKSVDDIYLAWHNAFSEQYRIIVGRGAGIIHWLGLWSDHPYVISECDFNTTIGPHHFESLFLPEIVRRAATTGRSVFHLDGPDAARHIDVLLDVPEIQAIQFTPGAGTPSALPWMDMFRKIQGRRRSLLIISPPHEVLSLCEALRPEGLGFLIDTGPSPAQLDHLYRQLCTRFGS